MDSPLQPAHQRPINASPLAHKYAFLEECPEEVLDPIITLPVGTLPERVDGICAWRDALLAGRLPPPDAWPPPELADPVRKEIGQLGILRFCKGEPEVASALLKDVVAAFAQQQTMLDDFARRLRELEEREKQSLASKRQELEKKVELLAEKWRPSPGGGPTPIELDGNTLQRLREKAKREIFGDGPKRQRLLGRGWQTRVQLWTQIAEVFGDLDEMLGHGWDLSLGVLRHTGWHNLKQLRELVKQLPNLREIVQLLGRLEVCDEEVSVAEQVFAPMRRLEEEMRETPTPLVPADTRGVERTGSIARMLPVEAAMLGHPKMSLLWHARRAEQALLTYRVEGMDVERFATERDEKGESETKRPLNRGPILAVIDTSGSMQGLPEQIAKALVLEALLSARVEKRRCRLYAFSGPGQVVEHELDLSPDGLESLLDFLGFSFGGGSDPSAAMDRVLQQMRCQEWERADVLVVSDGLWPASPDMSANIAQARERGTRFHGIQIGDRGRRGPSGLHDVCDPVHFFKDWLGLVQRGDAPAS